MSEKVIIPDEYQGSIRRLLSRIPPEQRDDETLQASLLIYLKLGGEKLARHYLEVSKRVFPDQMVLIKKQLREGIEEEESDEENPDDDADRDETYIPDFGKGGSDSSDYL